MRHPLHIVVLCIIAVLIAFVAYPALAQNAAPVIAPSSIWFDVWNIVQPLVVLLVSTVGPVLATWIAARLIALLKVNDEKQKLEIEAKLRDALHQSAANALKFAFAKSGVSAVAITGAVMGEAIRYVEEKNPDALVKLGVHQDALRDIILSKVPDLYQLRRSGEGAP